MQTPKIGSLILSAAFPLVAAIAMVASACSGKTVDSGSPGADASFQDGGGDASPLAPGCPATLPAEGTPCSHDQLLCEYGDDFDPRCNTIRVCSTDRWASPVSFGGRPTCPTSVPTVPPNPPECPATRAAVPKGAACTGTESCHYSAASCFCGRFCPSYPIRQPDCDAGVTQGCCDAKVQWNCFDGPDYCPTSRPRVGTACAKEGDSCALSPPVECGQATLACKNGVWNVVDFGCPVSSAKAKKEISYVDEGGGEQLRQELMSVHLATYRYKAGDDARHLGFIIEDMPPGSAAVLPSREHVDLYGYVSMAVAAIQAQQKEIDALKREVARLEAARAKQVGR